MLEPALISSKNLAKLACFKPTSLSFKNLDYFFDRIG